MPRHPHFQLKCNNLQETKRKNIYTTFCVVRLLSERPQGILVLKTTFAKWRLLRHGASCLHVNSSERECLFTGFYQLPYQLGTFQVVYFESPSSSDRMHKGLVTNYGEGGGLQNGKIAGPKLFAPPPPSRQGKTFCAPPFKKWKLFMPPLQYG